MSKRFLVPPTLPTGTSNPATGNIGDLFFRSDENKIYVYTSTGWIVASGNTATNLSGGAAGQVPYQSGVSTTAFTSTGTSGQVLTSNGSSAPTWQTPSAGGFDAFLLMGA